jgi:membrane protein implicated in regulation of membrane protease activity
MKFHFLSSIAFAVAVALMALAGSLYTRMLLLVPVLLLFYVTWILFAIEYERHKSGLWKKKEKKIIEETYSKFVRNYHKTKQI